MSQVNRFSLKKPQSWWWKTDLSLEGVKELLEAGRITADHLICPIGEADKAMPLSTFLEDTTIFDPKVKTTVSEIPIPIKKHSKVIRAGWTTFISSAVGLLIVSFILHGATPEKVLSQPDGYSLLILFADWLETLLSICLAVGAFTTATGYGLRL